ncbi:MAG TPA: DUF2071 domain-containing protein [Ohtaekwangia sp.]|nr:DUF2071 domain-containing protein [Ohtaekwangia sp.]
MKLPVLDGVIDRRILINYRIDPEVVKLLLPSHLEPLVINGYASGGVCLLRLKNIGLKFAPSFLRITSENAAHRFLISFEKNGVVHRGVYIPRRDTDSMLNVVLAGKFFSWPHYRAVFAVGEGNGKYAVSMQSRDGYTRLEVDARRTDHFPSNSMFDSLLHASCSFKDCALGVSPSTKRSEFKTIKLQTKTWNVTPLQVHDLKSSYFEDKSLFPHDTIQFDNALLMEGVSREWLSDDV